jgi:hypothetical protein
MHEQIRLLGDLESLRDPVFLCGFVGWTDTHGAAATAITHLAEQWGARPIAEIDPEPYYDFTVQRPHTKSVGATRTLEWPANRFLLASPPRAQRDFLLLAGIEPHLRWRSFLDAIVEVLELSHSTTSVTLGAQPGAVPHTRPTPVTLSASDAKFATQFGLEIPTSRYEGPTGVMSVLNLRLRALDWRNASLWAISPHYVSAGPNPHAVEALVRMIDRGYGTTTSLGGITEQIDEFDRQLQSALEPEGDAAAYVRTLEEQYDRQRGRPPEEDPLPPTGDILGDLERFLREQRGEGDAPTV